jgi:hypothetical protein
MVAEPALELLELELPLLPAAEFVPEVALSSGESDCPADIACEKTPAAAAMPSPYPEVRFTSLFIFSSLLFALPVQASTEM